MIKIKISEIFRHRNETTFRPYIMAKELFRDVGIEFVFEGNKYDLTWVGQASYSDKNHPYERSLSRGKWFFENKVEGDYVLFDGNDSASLMGTYDVFKQSKAKLLLKNSMYKDINEYSKLSIHGRTYWGMSTENKFNYSISLEETRSETFKKVQLSGCNWLSTISPNWFQYKGVHKDIDVCALFSFPAKENNEFCIQTNQYYDQHREKCINWLKKLPSNIKVAMLENGQKIPIDEYYKIMSRSKIIIAPFGYGEMAPRDLEASMVGSILIKPDMSHLETIPNPYIPNQTYIPVKWNFADLNEKIQETLNGFGNLQEFFVENMRKEYVKQYNPEKLVIHTYNWLSNLEGFGSD